MRNLIKFFIILLLSVIWTSCTNDPDPLGSNLVPDKDKLSSQVMDSYTDNFSQTSASVKYDSLSFASSSTILLGEYKNIKSEALLGFYITLPDSILSPYEADSASLVSAYLLIRPIYWIGDSTNFNFELHRINEVWSPSTITKDTIDAIHSTMGPNLFDQNTYSLNDTIMRFNMDQDLVKGWIQRTFDSTADFNYGMILTPVSNNAIMGFQGLTTYPYYSYPTLHMVFEKPGVFVDTVVAAPTIDVHYATGNPDPDPPQSILLQSTLGVREKLKFDLSLIPQNIFINKATLELTINPSFSDVGYISNNQFSVNPSTSDTIGVSLLTNYDADSVNSDIGQYRLYKSGEKYSGDVRLFVQKWVDGEDNQGLQLNLTDEVRTVNKVAVYNSDYAVDSLRPRLTIYYTSKK